MSGGGGPLSGVRVIDLAGLPAAYGTMLLAGLGADVVKVEPPEGDPLRHQAPFLEGVAPPENSLWFAYLGQGKRSVTVRDEAELERLLAGADAVVDSSAPGVHDQLRTRHPELVWVAITPYGLDGPYRDRPGSNLTGWASSGVLYVTGFPDRPPVVPGGPVQLAYQLTALHATSALLLALRARRLDPAGRGQLVDISVQECCLAMAPETGLPLFLDDRVHRDRPGNRRAVTRPFGLYPCTDGHVSFLVLGPAHWHAMAAWIHEVTGNEGILEEIFVDIAVRAEATEFIDEATEDLCSRFTKLELFTEAQQRGIPCTPVNTVADLRADPHLEAVGYFEPTEHPALGSFRRPGPPFRFDRDWWRLARAPLLGEHTAELLG
jgi:crotonobetainyl-CoA:carnitine CoA-transferase CaiB-like acyl-CoA transferase